MNAYNIMQRHPRYFEDFVTRATYHSNRIEGSTLSLADTRAILWGDDSDHTPPEANQVPQLMMQLVYEYEHSSLDPFRREAEFHIRFERIHPLSDGNGRTGRILIARNLMLAGYAPPVISSDLGAEYLGAVESADYVALENMLRDASDAECQRMQELTGA